MKAKNKLLVLAFGIIVVIVCVIVVLFIRSKQWEQDITIKGGEWVANGYKNGFLEGDMFGAAEKGNPYYEYEITNETNHKMKDVVIVFECRYVVFKKKWTYNFDVGYLRPGETKTIKVYHWDMFPDAEKYGAHESDIKRVKYKKQEERLLF